MSDTPFCAEDGGQHDVGHECVVTGRDDFSIRSFISTTTEAPPAADNQRMNEALREKYLLFAQPLLL